VEQAAAQMLSELFFKPMLAEMRKFPFGRDLATGGQTESVFGERLDERVADSAARSATGLTRQIVRDLQRPATKAASDAQTQPPSAGTDRAHWPAAMQANSQMTRGDA
jgi:Rod binding domain-containing protein